MESISDLERVIDFNNLGGYQEIDGLSEDVVSSLIDPSVPKPMKITNIAAYDNIIKKKTQYCSCQLQLLIPTLNLKFLPTHHVS